MYLFYVNNEDYPKAKSVAEQLAADGPQLKIRNPEDFSGPGELRKAKKVFVYGNYPEVVEAAEEADVECEQLQEESTGSDEPSMDWKKDELTAYAESNDIEVVSSDTKQDILDKINEADNT